MTDEYLIKGNSFSRLLDDWKKHGTLVVAFDFDSTVYDFHNKGFTYPKLIEILQESKNLGFYCICFTASDYYDKIEKYCKDNDIPLDGINVNPPFFKNKSKTVKIYYNVLLDDRAGLIQAYEDLYNVINYIKLLNKVKETNESIISI